MARFTFAFSLFVGLSSFVCAAQRAPQSGKTTQDEQRIEEQIDRLVSDWNTHAFHNMDTYATEDVDWVNLVGMWWKGRPEVKKSHQVEVV